MELGQSTFVPGGEGSMESFDPNINPELDELGYSIAYQQGGQVMDQNTLMCLALLSQMQQQNNQKTYDDTPLEVTSQPTIAEHFGSQNKTLGGSSTKSLSQLMGR